MTGISRGMGYPMACLSISRSRPVRRIIIGFVRLFSSAPAAGSVRTAQAARNDLASMDR